MEPWLSLCPRSAFAFGFSCNSRSSSISSTPSTAEVTAAITPPIPLTAEQLRQHPEFPHTTWDLPAREKGILPVAKDRGGPVNVAWEIHGDGPEHMVWIMGLGGMKWAWQRQTKDFSHKQGDVYTSLVVDNRGMGESDKPLMRYSTSEMAKDLIEVLDHVGWTEKRQLHVVGISMGGMIAQELAYLIPDRVRSLSLVSTAPRLVNTVGFIENLRNRINLFIPRSIDAQLAHVKYNLYTPSYLTLPDETEAVVEPFPTNGDRFAASEVIKRSQPQYFGRKGFMAQAVACGWHHKSAAQLSELADKVGRQRIMVVHGSQDRMITFPHGEMLLSELGGEEAGVTKAFFQDQGHVIPIEKRKEFNALVVGMVEKVKGLEE